MYFHTCHKNNNMKTKDIRNYRFNFVLNSEETRELNLLQENFKRINGRRTTLGELVRELIKKEAKIIRDKWGL